MAMVLLLEPLPWSIWQHSATAKDPNCQATWPRTIDTVIKEMLILLRGEPKATDSA